MRLIHSHTCSLARKKTFCASHQLHTVVSNSKRQHGHWKDAHNQRDYFENLAKELNITRLDDWYSVTTDNVKKKGGKGLLKHYDVSLLNALRTVYPEHDWLPWKFNRVPQGFWKDMENQKSYISWFTKNMGISSDSQWLRIKYSDLRNNHGYGLLECYGFSILNMLESVYPEKKDYFRQLWMHAKIERQNEQQPLFDPSISHKQATAFPDGFWNDIPNRKYLFDWIAQKLGVKSPSDWYKVTVTDVRKMGGASVLACYNNSLYSALKSIYQDYPWMAWKFVQVPRGYWKDDRNTMEYLMYLSEQLNITRLEDWYNVSAYDVAALGGGWIVRKHGGLLPLLARFYPGFQWNIKAFRTKSKGQLLVTRYCKELFPYQSMDTDFRHPKLFFAGTNRNMEFDIYFPDLNLALEYQGEQHYLWSNLHGSPEHQQARDKEKQEACQQEGIRMVVVPFWWDRTKESLQATIHQQYPDLIDAPIIGKPISPDMPMLPPSKSVVTSTVDFPDWQVWNESMAANNVWMTSRVNGVPCFINQKKQCFLYGSTNPIELPKHIAESIPNVAIEGILMESEQEGTQLAVYDVPSQRSLTYEDRQKFIQQNFGSSTHFYIPRRIQCSGQEHLRTFLASSEETGSDINGLLITKPHSRYGEALSAFLLKSYLEEYAVVVESSQMGLICETRSGEKVTLRTKHTSKIGDVITIEYMHKEGSGVPYAPRFVKSNPLLKWDDLLSKKRSQGVAYHLALGLRRGAPIPKCRVCGHVFADRDEPRVIVKGAFIPPQNPEPHPVSYRLCATPKCIESAYTTLSQNLSYGTWIPPFQKKIAVTKAVHDRMVALNRVPELGGEVEWIISGG